MKTKAWIRETAISNPIKAKNIMKGIKVITAIIKLPENNLNKYVDNIFSNVWPATILANNRTPNDTDLAKYETNSINTNRGTKAKGVPTGIKKEKNFIPCIDKAKMVTPIKIVILKPRDTTPLAVTANE